MSYDLRLLAISTVAVLFASCVKSVVDAPIVATVASNAGDPGGGTTPIITYPIQYRSTVNISQARFGMGAAGAGDKILFAGGVADSFDVNTMIHFYNVATVDIFNTTTLQRTTAQLSIPRCWPAAVSLGKKIYFAGGFANGGLSNRVDIYDVSSNVWTTASLSAPRANIVAAAIGHYVVFAGGFDGVSPAPYTYASPVIDIYNTLTNTWSTGSFLSRKDPAAAAAGSSIAIAGYKADGTTWARMFNTSTNSWSSLELSAHYNSYGGGMAVAGAGQKIIFAYSGDNITPYPVVDILNLTNNTLSQRRSSKARTNTADLGLGNYIFIAGGQGPLGGPYDDIEVFNVVNNKWYNKTLQTGLYYPVGAGAGTTLMFAENDGLFPGSGERPVQVFRVTGEPPSIAP